LIGRERALIYKTLVLTGLRKGELDSLFPVQLFLDTAPAFAMLDAADEKNRKGSSLPIREDLANDLKQWLADKLARLQNEARRHGAPVPVRLPPDCKVFDVPKNLYRHLDRDLVEAGIARWVGKGKARKIDKRDDRGWTIDVHALRTTFGTLLSKAGVMPRTAQDAMRHSTIDLTMKFYTDPRLLDVHGAVDALPALPLDGTDPLGQALQATGTDARSGRRFAPRFAPATDFPCASGSIAVNSTGNEEEDSERVVVAASDRPVKTNTPLTTAVNGASLDYPQGDSNHSPGCFTEPKTHGNCSKQLHLRHVG
jgi:hypothetical protein